MTTQTAGRLGVDPSEKSLLQAASKEARSLGHGWLGAEHLLLAILREGGIGRRLLRDAGVDLSLARQQIAEALGAGEESPSEVSLTPRMQRIIGIAEGMAMQAGREITAEHLLFGLLTAGDSVATSVMKAAGADPDGLAAKLRPNLGPAVAAKVESSKVRGKVKESKSKHRN